MSVSLGVAPDSGRAAITADTALELRVPIDGFPLALNCSSDTKGQSPTGIAIAFDGEQTDGAAWDYSAGAAYPPGVVRIDLPESHTGWKASDAAVTYVKVFVTSPTSGYVFYATGKRG